MTPLGGLKSDPPGRRSYAGRFSNLVVSERWLLAILSRDMLS